MKCGIDEAGRGPLAGPLVVAGVVIKKEIKGLNDSKKLTEKKREELFDVIIKNCDFHIVFKSAKEIDEKGISSCLKSSILEIMENIEANSYLMDGNTSFGIKTLQHKIKADATEEEVSAASILAKVSRDRFMCEIASKYPNYNFEKHKGYGTQEHVDTIKKFGRCELHRKSFKLKALGEESLGVQKTLF
ncbi:ribonuclease HII [Halarcobacter ebronensis]|uniref:Ribonuclease HII n=1 Tax=Halarcobacter ebronensis TaxID=1462615 RepID=A0A4Q1ART4_9BACT|nr:ribonuclease HII [Halarcobacter ebronensis]QKF82759.1 ribonuclease HII [Halarcobacter ebronensis]RXK06784.1 ribonuclease HII [Halarcobacter ebronensis]